MNIDLLLDFTSMKRVHASQSTKMFVGLRCFKDVSKDLDQKAKIDSKWVNSKGVGFQWKYRPLK